MSMKTVYFDIETIPSQLPGVRDEYIAAVTAPALPSGWLQTAKQRARPHGSRPVLTVALGMWWQSAGLSMTSPPAAIRFPLMVSASTTKK
jgi:hypothetical protein